MHITAGARTIWLITVFVQLDKTNYLADYCICPDKTNKSLDCWWLIAQWLHTIMLITAGAAFDILPSVILTPRTSKICMLAK